MGARFKMRLNCSFELINCVMCYVLNDKYYEISHAPITFTCG